MPKLPPVTGAEVLKALRRGGFVFNRQSGSHVILKDRERDLTVSVPTHSARDLPPGTLRGVLRQANLTVEDFRKLLDG